MASLSQEEENYVRMSLLLKGFATRAARALFDREFHPSRLDSSLKKAHNKLMDLKKKHVINDSQWKLLFTRFPDVPDSKTFDVTLMIALLRNLTEMSPPLCGYDRLPSVIDTTPGADLARIKHYRNYMAHLNDEKVDSVDFNAHWNDITNAIARLGGPQMKQECDQLKSKLLDQTNHEIMMDIKRSYGEIKDLKESVESLKLSNTEIKESHADVTKELQKIKASQKDTVPWNIRGKQWGLFFF
ncbi:unnamed protein product [Mytilus edulis]|uniref:DZIP3-like HEPN domain-containing protein n=1 Tax=Mytilus edulis TaxID=6550 RepID=A0A8S3SKI3_MYTED|nr:unnamed protein product [Mytilus edulis]